MTVVVSFILAYSLRHNFMMAETAVVEMLHQIPILLVAYWIGFVIFKPYAGVSTAVLFFTKGEPTKKVWFYQMEADGFSLDDKRTFIDGRGDIPDIIEKFRRIDKEKYDDRKAKCFFVPIEEIESNGFDLSISKYKEIVHDEVKYEKPEVIKRKILELEEEIVKGLKELEV